jgi:hypothetical protein
MIGAYLQGSFNLASAYYFYDNTSASSYVTGTLNAFSNMGFLYTDGSEFLNICVNKPFASSLHS